MGACESREAPWSVTREARAGEGHGARRLERDEDPQGLGRELARVLGEDLRRVDNMTPEELPLQIDAHEGLYKLPLSLRDRGLHDVWRMSSRGAAKAETRRTQALGST